MKASRSLQTKGASLSVGGCTYFCTLFGTGGGGWVYGEDQGPRGGDQDLRGRGMLSHEVLLVLDGSQKMICMQLFIIHSGRKRLWF